VLQVAAGTQVRRHTASALATTAIWLTTLVKQAHGEHGQRWNEHYQRISGFE
jgi:hypothetical protein